MSPRILIVDDESLIRQLVARALERSGYEAQVAEDGREALRILEGETFDLVLTDAVMPNMSGIELLRIVKQDHPGTRVVIMTGHARDHDISEFLIAGADDYMAKPIHLEDLERVLRKVLGERS